MPRVKTAKIVRSDLLEHPAVRAWRELQSVHVEPERIEILKGKLPSQTKRTKRFVCRLVGVGPAGSDIIGKRCWRSKAVIESRIYKEILPYLPIPSLNYYGLVDDANGRFCWLFLEDAGEQECSTANGVHRELIAQWLGLMHTSAIHVDAPAFLPGKGPNHYLERLRFTRDAILENLANLTLQADNLAPLETILRQFDLLESHWDQVRAFCERTPQTLVHGDFAAKNLRVRSSQAGMALLPFDWGEAGWGIPAVDIMQVDVASYWSIVRGHWPWLDVHAVQRLVIVGKIFRCLDGIYWELPGFKYVWLKKPFHSMNIYASRLADAIRAAGLIHAVESEE